MGLRDTLDDVADKAASVISSVFVTTPDHPNRGGNTGQGPGVEENATPEKGSEDDTATAVDDSTEHENDS